MNAARQSDAVSWWTMGRNAQKRNGLEHALEMANDINNEGARRLFKSGALGEPRPTVRRSRAGSV